jgi:hypothetical protein
VDEERQRKDPLRPRLPWYLGDEIEIQDSLLSPTGDYLLVVFGDEGDDSKQDQMPKWDNGENAAPSELIDQQSPDRRPHGQGQSIATGPYAQGSAALSRIGPDDADDRDRCR